MHYQFAALNCVLINETNYLVFTVRFARFPNINAINFMHAAAFAIKNSLASIFRKLC